MFVEPAMSFEGAVISSCGEADREEETCTNLGRWTLQNMLLFVEEMCL